MKTCSTCGEEKPFTEYHKDKRMKSGCASACKLCVKAYQLANNSHIVAKRAEWRAATAEHRRVQRKARYDADPERFRKVANERYKANKEDMNAYNKQWRAANAARFKELGYLHRKAKPYMYNHYMAKRRSVKLRATPLWFTSEKDQIAALYAEAKRLTIDTGIKHEVDHIIPLQSTVVCGLHCLANLQILTKQENNIKYNKLIE